MDDLSAIAERIQGRPFVTGAHAPFRLDDPEHLYFVAEGFLDIFAVETRFGEPINRRLFVARLEAGKIAFGGPSFAVDRSDPGYRIGLLCVASQNAVVIRGRRGAVASAEGLDMDTTIWVDEWVFALSEFLTRDLGAPPSAARRLEADPQVPYPAETTLTAQHLDIIWMSATRPVRFVGLDGWMVETGNVPLPLTERTWVEVDSDTEISGVYTPTAFITGQVWPALDAFHVLVQKYAVAIRLSESRLLKDRHEMFFAAREASKTTMFHTLADTLAISRDSIQADRQTGLTPLHTVTSLVAGSIGIKVAAPRNARDLDNPLETITALTRPAGIYIRRLSLTPGWWRRNGPSFIGVEVGEGRPLALLSDGHGHYRAVDPAAGATYDVDDRKASGIGKLGLMLYAPLPDSIHNGLAALLHTLRGFRREFFILIAMAVLGGLAALLVPVATGQLLAKVIPRVDTPMWTAYLGALVLGAFASATFDIVRGMAMLYIQSRADERLQAAVWNRLLALPAKFFRNYSAGDLADRANGISQIRQLITEVAASSIVSGVASVFTLLLLFWYSWRLALIACALVLVLMIATWIFARGQMKHLRAAFTLRGVIEGLVFQMISGLAKLRIAHTESYALARWAEKYAEQKRETFAARKWIAAQISFNSTVTPLGMIAIFAFIQYMIFEGQGRVAFGLADFLTFNAAFAQFAAAMTALTSAWTMVITAIPLFERVQPILAAEPEVIRGGLALEDLTGHIEFSNVSFRYQPEVPYAIDGVSFRIRAGDYVAFVGPSGSGKSTIYRLLVGFERPDSGAIFFDNHDQGSLDLRALRKRMGVVLQDGQLLAANIFKNIAGAASLTMEEAWEAARAAGLAEDIEAMPMGMYTVLPEGGTGLSGGQKQRLLIARALAHKPRIMLLDEATSALDNRTQAIVQASLKSINATRVVIAHRVSTVRDADRIYVLDSGKIIDSGKYEELLERGGPFAELVRRQII